jgi:pyruvate formate lyase activating enzyme
MSVEMKEAVLYQKLQKNLVRCQACSWKCTIAPGNTGICGIRLNKKGKLYLTVYGKAVGMHLDPVEKKPLNHFLPGTTALSFGTIGCDFGCLFCQNWQMSQTPREIRKTKASSLEKTKMLMKAIEDQSESWKPKDIVDYAMRVGASSIAYTYNEPTIFVEYAYDTAKLAKKKRLKNIFVSNGYESDESLEYIGPYLDAINIDLKSFNPRFYEQISGAKLEPVLKNIKKTFKKGVHVEVTTLVIPTKNDSLKELRQIAEFIKAISPEIPWHVTAFHPDYKMLDLPPTPIEKLHQAWEIGKKAGLKYVYTGNIPDFRHASTYCPECNGLLIERIGYMVEVKMLNIKKGECKSCKTKIAGVWQT